jgi:hypothetical protein
MKHSWSFLCLLLMSSPVSAQDILSNAGGLEQLPQLLDALQEHKRAIETMAGKRTEPAVKEMAEKARSEASQLPPPLLPSAAVRSDPFQISYKMQQLAWMHGQGGAQFVTAPGAKPPAMSLKGLVNKSLALLEVNGAGVYMVREGDTISLNKTGENIVIRIEKVDSLSLNVKVGTLQEVVVVR